MKKSIIILIGTIAIILALVLGYIAFVKPKSGEPVNNNMADVALTKKPATTEKPTTIKPEPTMSNPIPMPDGIAKTYVLDCTNEPEKFQSKYFWYNHFEEQIIENWSLEIVCYNDESNKVVYLISKINWESYVYDPNRTSYGLSQLGIYDIEKDTYDKAPSKNLRFYEGCGIIKEWNNNEIIYQCGSGDAGVGDTNTFSYNTIDKTVRLIEECNIQAGREPEKICSKK